jgi:hypothetical protein
MNHGPPLLPGERVLWAGLRGQPVRVATARAGLGLAYAWMLLCFVVGTGAVPLLLFETTRPYMLAAVVAVLALVVAYRWHKKRPAIFVTDRRLVDRSLLGTRSVELAAIVTCARQVTHLQERYSGRELGQVASNLLVVGDRAGRGTTLGPVLEYDELSSFVSGVIARDIDPTTMRGLDGAPAAAERREDIFVAVDNRTDGDPYGLLFLGPRGLLRFTSRPSLAIEGMVLTALAAAGPLEELENRVAFLARRPDAGHVLLVDRTRARLRLTGNTLLVTVPEPTPTAPERTVSIELRAEDAERARRYLAQAG